MTGRMYSIAFAEVAVSAAQDLIAVTATAGMAFRIHRIELGQRGLAAWEAKPVKLIRLPATVTAGSGGTAAAAQRLNNGDAAPTLTARANDTTPASTSGTASVLVARDWELLNGLLIVFTPDERPVIAPGQSVSLNLPVAPSAAMTASGTMVVEELF
ncbi:MAG: hypothetical protein ABI306_04270 [Caulobacteraceae bacterium]